MIDAVMGCLVGIAKEKLFFFFFLLCWELCWILWSFLIQLEPIAGGSDIPEALEPFHPFTFTLWTILFHDPRKSGFAYVNLN